MRPDRNEDSTELPQVVSQGGHADGTCDVLAKAADRPGADGAGGS